jgi:hypothetical protein
MKDSLEYLMNQLKKPYKWDVKKKDVLRRSDEELTLYQIQSYNTK